MVTPSRVTMMSNEIKYRGRFEFGTMIVMWPLSTQGSCYEGVLEVTLFSSSPVQTLLHNRVCKKSDQAQHPQSGQKLRLIIWLGPSTPAWGHVAIQEVYLMSAE